MRRNYCNWVLDYGGGGEESYLSLNEVDVGVALPFTTPNDREGYVCGTINWYSLDFVSL